MRRSIRILAILAALVVLAALSSKSAPLDPNHPDTVSVDTVSTYISGSGVVPVRFWNDEPLVTVEVTLHESSSSIKVDSFSFAGGRVAAAQFKLFRLNSDSTIVDITVLVGSQAAIPSGSGLLGNLYFHWAIPVAPQVVSIDTVTWVNQVNVEYTTTFIDTLSNSFTPQFRPGQLNLQADPIRYDSLWVANVQANVGSTATVDLSLFNQKPLQDISLALTWGSDRLTFDSVSYTGLRGESAPTKGLNRSNSAKQLLATLAYDPGSSLPAGTGVLARLYFTAAANAPETTIVIDSTSYQGSQSTYVVLTAADGGTQFTPMFRSGSVALKIGTGVDDGRTGSLPKVFSLDQNYPNPFNPTTQIQFGLPKASQVRIDIYNVLGAQVRTLVNQRMEAGFHRLTFDGRSADGRTLATGIYFYRLSTPEFVQSKKMLLMK